MSSHHRERVPDPGVGQGKILLLLEVLRKPVEPRAAEAAEDFHDAVDEDRALLHDRPLQQRRA
jgi:hypothetical protein